MGKKSKGGKKSFLAVHHWVIRELSVPDAHHPHQRYRDSIQDLRTPQKTQQDTERGVTTSEDTAWADHRLHVCAISLSLSLSITNIQYTHTHTIWYCKTVKPLQSRPKEHLKKPTSKINSKINNNSKVYMKAEIFIFWKQNVIPLWHFGKAPISTASFALIKQRLKKEVYNLI